MLGQYRIPKSLDTSRFDVTINLKMSDGTPIKHLNLGLVIYVIIAVFSVSQVITMDAISQTPILLKAVLFALLLSVLMILAFTDVSGRRFVMSIPFYTNKQPKKIETLMPFASIIDENTVQMTNGKYMQVYKISGRISALLFDSEMNGIIDGYSLFLRQLKDHPGISYKIATMKHVVEQSESLDCTKKLASKCSNADVLNKYIKYRKTMLSTTNVASSVYEQYMFVLGDSFDDFVYFCSNISPSFIGDFEPINSSEILDLSNHLFLHFERDV